ncbi:hypothetical protein CTAYLR_007869 [Chrysophaeum taylorii]|uniref:Large ribosomal subunit protein uL18c n=1 Tax=Chrysophaeum taylorii TaxID=2483200 RepID=A0AAD7UD51_9STRA|nr:hypothetical protein CTAYLR_007869 [Chrysophaeum taylorii]
MRTAKLLGFALTLSVSGALVAPSGCVIGKSRTMSPSVVMVNTGSQVPFRIRRKRLLNQDRGRLRLNVFKSHNHIYAQVIDDVEGRTLAACSTLDKEVKEKIDNGGNIAAASVVGAHLAEKLKDKGIESLYYDRFSGSHKYLFHGRVKALVDGVREGGIQI